MYNGVESGYSFFRGNREEGLKILSTLAKQGHKDANEFFKQINN